MRQPSCQLRDLNFNFRAQLHHRIVGQAQEISSGAGIVVHLSEELFAPLDRKSVV